VRGGAHHFPSPLAGEGGELSEPGEGSLERHLYRFHNPIRLGQDLDDLVIVLDIFKRQLASLAVLQPLLRGLIAAIEKIALFVLSFFEADPGPVAAPNREASKRRGHILPLFNVTQRRSSAPFLNVP
jgi:hypothetical protein